MPPGPRPPLATGAKPQGSLLGGPPAMMPGPMGPIGPMGPMMGMPGPMGMMPPGEKTAVLLWRLHYST